MYNPDQHYQAHALHLKDLSEQAEQCQMIAALTQHRHARVHAAGRWLGALWVRLGTWLAHSTLRDEQPMRHEAARVQKASLSELAGCTSQACATSHPLGQPVFVGFSFEPDVPFSIGRNAARVGSARVLATAIGDTKRGRAWPFL